MAFQKGQNSNHPKKGSSTLIEPIKKIRDIANIKRLLADKPRDYALFVLGINLGLRASDLLRLRAGQVRYLKPGEDFVVKEKKGKKLRRLTWNKACHTAIRGLLAIDEFTDENYTDENYIFRSQRSDRLTVPSLNLMVKKWCKMINIRGNFGSHTLRKSWAYHMRITHNVEIPILMEALGHSSQQMTLRYCCIQSAEVRNVYMNEI